MRLLTSVSRTTSTSDATKPGGALSFSVAKRMHLRRMRRSTYLKTGTAQLKLNDYEEEGAGRYTRVSYHCLLLASED